MLYWWVCRGAKSGKVLCKHWVSLLYFSQLCSYLLNTWEHKNTIRQIRFDYMFSFVQVNKFTSTCQSFVWDYITQTLSNCYRYIQRIRHCSLRSCNNAKNGCRCLYTTAEELSSPSVNLAVKQHITFYEIYGMTLKYSKRFLEPCQTLREWWTPLSLNFPVFGSVK